MRTDWKLAAGTVAVAGALALPASASAAITAGPLAPCYQAMAPNGVPSIPVTLTGGTPGDLYQLIATDPGTAAGSAGSVSPTTPFDVNGDGAATLTHVYPPGDPIDPVAGRKIDLSVEDFNANGDTTTPIGTVLTTELALNVADKPSDPRKAREVTISGTPFANKKLYGFITNKTGTKIYKRFYLGKGNVCGYAARKEIVEPPHDAAGNYRLYVNTGDKLSKKASLNYPFQIESF